MNYYFCDACHYCFEAESLPDRCPDCGKCHQIFGKSHLDETAQAYHLPVLARLPIDPAVAEACDAGRVESLDTTELEPALQAILAR